MRYAILLIALVALFAVACNGDGEEGQPTPTASPAPTATTLPPTPTAIPEPTETLAFIRDGDIWLIDADGSNERRLGLTDVQTFTWVSSDELDVATGGGQPRHLLVDLEGNVRELPFPTGGSWSRDGTLYVVPVDQQVVVFNRDGSEAARLEVEPPVEGGEKPRPCGVPLFTGEPDRLLFSRPALSPDNRDVAVAVNCQSRVAIVGNLLTPVIIVALDGSEQRPVGELQANVGGAILDFSPDGSRVAVTDSFHISGCARAWGLQVSDLAGTEVTAISLAAIEAARATGGLGEQLGGVIGYDWSPESDAVVASFNLSNCERQPSIRVVPVLKGLYIVGLDRSSEEQLVEGATRSPAWSPSGRYIAFVAQEFFGEVTEPPAIRLFDLTTRQVIDLVQGSQPAWQPQP